MNADAPQLLLTLGGRVVCALNCQKMKNSADLILDRSYIFHINCQGLKGGSTSTSATKARHRSVPNANEYFTSKKDLTFYLWQMNN
jgi:hypothetical protein